MRRFAFLTLILLAPSASAHVESLPGQGESLARASWLGPDPPAIEYDEIPPHGGIRYYTIDLRANETVRIRLARSPDSFTTSIPPSLAIMGPGLQARGFSPAFLERPDNATIHVIQGVPTDRVEYDAVAAIATSTLVASDLTPPETARYVFAVFDEDQGGRFALEVGEFAPFGFYRVLGIPRGASDMRAWEGQTWAHASLPTVLGMVAGIAIAYQLTRRQKERRLSGLGWFSLGAAVLILASGASYAHQAAHHASLGLAALTPTLGLSAAHVLLAAMLTWNGLREPERPTRIGRARTALLGIIGVLLWAGFLWGPAMAILASLIPEDPPPSAPREA